MLHTDSSESFSPSPMTEDIPLPQLSDAVRRLTMNRCLPPWAVRFGVIFRDHPEATDNVDRTPIAHKSTEAD